MKKEITLINASYYMDKITETDRMIEELTDNMMNDPSFLTKENIAKLNALECKFGQLKERIAEAKTNYTIDISIIN